MPNSEDMTPHTYEATCSECGALLYQSNNWTPAERALHRKRVHSAVYRHRKKTGHTGPVHHGVVETPPRP